MRSSGAPRASGSGAVRRVANLRRFAANEQGATAIEYSLIAALIGIVIITAVGALGSNLSNKFSAIAANLT